MGFPPKRYTRVPSGTLMGWALVCLASCEPTTPVPARSAADPPRTLEAWEIVPEPLLAIGVVSGAEAYQLHDVRGVARLPDGRLVVANSGSGELRFFDEGGSFLFSKGGRGPGPGEFRSLDRIRTGGPDTLLVMDGGLWRTSFYSWGGEYLGQVPWPIDEVFPSDDWLYDRWIVQSPLAQAHRGVVTRALDAITPEEPGAFAFARATESGHVWVTDHLPPAGEPARWTIYDLDGRALAWMEVPARTILHDIGPDWAVVVRRDGLDVEHVQLHELSKPANSVEPRGLRASSRDPSVAPPTHRHASPDEMPELMTSVKQLASLQELFYSRHYRYASSLDSLADPRIELSIPDDVEVELVAAHARGWVLRGTQETSGRGCLLPYGNVGLVGVKSGALHCWGDAMPPERPSPSPTKGGPPSTKPAR